MRSGCRALGPKLLLGLTIGCLVGAADATAAEVRVLEVVGAVPLDQATRAAGLPKDRALEQALWEGVSRVAADLLVDSIVAEPEDGSDPVRSALGDDTVPYTRSFRIVEDQGERPMLFTEHPDAATEYVVVVEVQVEVDKVRQRLVAAGLLVDEGITVPLTGIRLEVRDLTRYAGYQRLVELLESDAVGAASVSPLELARERLLLHVEAEWGAEELLQRLMAAAPLDLQIQALEVEDFEASGGGWGLERGPARLVISVRWTPPRAGDDSAGLGRPGSGGRPAGTQAAWRGR